MVYRFASLITMGDARERIETLKDRITSSDDITDADEELLLDFTSRLDLLQQKYSDLRHEKLLRHGAIIAENTGEIAAAVEDRDTAENVVAWINRTYDNPETNRDYRVALRVIGRRTVGVDEDEVPEALEWVPTGTPSNYDPTPDPRDMLSWQDDVLSMIDNCHNARDEAMIALQFDAGLRGGEFKALTLGDIQDHKHGLQVTVEGKQGRRTVTLIPSAPYVNDWLNRHPAPRTGSDAPMWSKLHSVDDLSDQMVGKVFREAARRAGVSKPITLTNFRKSSAAFLASRNLNQAHIEDHHGWVRGSRAAARYIAVFGEDTDRELAKVHGIEIGDEDKADPIAPIACPRCGRDVPRHEPVCGGCGQAMTPAAAQELAAVNDDFDEARDGTEDPEAALLFEKLGDQLDMDPAIVQRLLEQHGGH